MSGHGKWSALRNKVLEQSGWRPWSERKLVAVFDDEGRRVPVHLGKEPAA